LSVVVVRFQNLIFPQRRKARKERKNLAFLCRFAPLRENILFFASAFAVDSFFFALFTLKFYQ